MSTTGESMDACSPAVIRRCIAKHFPAARDITLNRITTGLFNTSYFVGSTSGEMVIRIAPPADTVFVFYERDMMKQEPDIHRMLLERTDVPVARIRAFDQSREIIDRDYLIMERLPGKPMSESGYGHAHLTLRQVGEHLRRTHSLTADRYGYLGAHRPMVPRDTWVDAFTVMWNKLIDDVVSVGHYDRGEADSLRSLLDRHLAVFDRPVTSSLLHMDIWAQNILVDPGGNVTGLVDWDRALWGDVEIELAVLDYCGISEPPFWEGYGAERELSDQSRVRRVFYLLYELQKYIVIRQGRGNDAATARAYKRQVMDIVSRSF
jgi:aminoglycoside phosphotransferase (APT) family kinase protein